MGGPKKGSDGAKRIGDAHRGSHKHDQGCGFAAHPERASVSGRIGGETSFARYGRRHFREIGLKGGAATKEKWGPQHYAEIGRKGGTAKGLKNKKT